MARLLASSDVYRRLGDPLGEAPAHRLGASVKQPLAQAMPILHMVARGVARAHDSGHCGGGAVRRNPASVRYRESTASSCRNQARQGDAELGEHRLWIAGGVAGGVLSLPNRHSTASLSRSRADLAVALHSSSDSSFASR